MLGDKQKRQKTMLGDKQKRQKINENAHAHV